MEGILVARSHKVMFYGVPGEGAAVKYCRMQGFTDMSTSKNPKEYTRQYVDELFEQTDITGYSPSTSYGFDQYKGNLVHDDIVKITDSELIGNNAIREIVMVDLSKPVSGSADTYEAVKRSFSVIPDAEGGSLDAYTYTGNFKVKGEKLFGKAVLSEKNTVAAFTENSADAPAEK